MNRTLPVIPFIERHRNSDSLALCDDTDSMTYQELSQAVEQRAQNWLQMLPVRRPVVMMFIDNTITSVVDYLTALRLDYVVLLLNPDCSQATREQYVRMLQPNAVIGDGTVTLLNRDTLATDPRLSLLLSTSGSTGVGKCVALSRRNLEVNCQSILSYLPVRADDITLGTMPLSYSYGLSVLHTHLQAGAGICFTAHSVFDKAFWEVIKTRPISSMGGVPSFYEMLLRLRLTQMELPALRYFTQAGGKLAKAHIVSLADYANQAGKAFYVMYGQTEASPRMAYLAPEKVADKPHSIGQAIPGGEFRLENCNSDGEGELYYRGENVMLGYVSSVSDLSTFSPEEWLATGDLAVCDADGDYTITGRTKRIIKIAGERVNLDAVEDHCRTQSWDIRCTGEDNLLAVYARDASQSVIIEYCKHQLNIPPRNVTVVNIQEWPLLANGKVNYQALTEQLKEA